MTSYDRAMMDDERWEREHDTREKIERDARVIADNWSTYGGKSTFDAHDIIALLDRQAAITEREVMRYREKVHPDCDCCGWTDEVSELQAELDAYDQTYMKLPVDADGVPIRIGDLIKLKEDPDREASTDFYITIGKAGVRLNGDGWEIEPSRFVHVKPRTVEDVLEEFAHVGIRIAAKGGIAVNDVNYYADKNAIAKYAAEIRELMEVDA